MTIHLNLSVLELSKLYVNSILIRHCTRDFGVTIKQEKMVYISKFYKEIMFIFGQWDLIHSESKRIQKLDKLMKSSIRIVRYKINIQISITLPHYPYIIGGGDFKYFIYKIIKNSEIPMYIITKDRLSFVGNYKTLLRKNKYQCSERQYIHRLED